MFLVSLYFWGIVPPGMELRHLRYFIAVAEEENVTRAAARLHVSQPPLTRQIHDLEAELGVALFDRRGKTIRLNAAGQVFLEEARATLQRVEEAIAKVKATSGASSEIHLGYAPSPSRDILPALMRALQKTMPPVRIRLHDHSSPEMLRGLREGRLEAALMMQPRKAAAHGVIFKPLRQYPIGVVAARAHRIAKRQFVTMTDLLAEPLVVYARSDYPDYHDLLRQVAGAKTRRLRLVEECDSGPSLISALQAGKGVSILPSVVVHAARPALRFVPLRPAPVPAVVGIAYLAHPHAPGLGRLLEVAQGLAIEP